MPECYRYWYNKIPTNQVMKDSYVWGPGICEGDGNTASWYWNRKPENTVPMFTPLSREIYRQISLPLEKSYVYLKSLGFGDSEPYLFNASTYLKA